MPPETNYALREEALGLRPGFRIGRNVMIRECENLVAMRNLQAALMKRVECVPRALVDQAAIDIEQRFIFLLGNDMVVPHLRKQGLHGLYPRRRAR